MTKIEMAKYGAEFAHRQTKRLRISKDLMLRIIRHIRFESMREEIPPGAVPLTASYDIRGDAFFIYLYNREWPQRKGTDPIETIDMDSFGELLVGYRQLGGPLSIRTRPKGKPKPPPPPKPPKKSKKPKPTPKKNSDRFGKRMRGRTFVAYTPYQPRKRPVPTGEEE